MSKSSQLQPITFIVLAKRARDIYVKALRSDLADY